MENLFTNSRRQQPNQQQQSKTSSSSSSSTSSNRSPPSSSVPEFGDTRQNRQHANKCNQLILANPSSSSSKSNYRHQRQAQSYNNNNNSYTNYGRTNRRRQFYDQTNRRRNVTYYDENYQQKTSVSSEAADFSKLPSVVLANIYSRLELSDRLRASATCKTWRHALLNTPSLWHHYPLMIYLLVTTTTTPPPRRDLLLRSSYFSSAQFKLTTLAKYVHSLTLNYDPNNNYESLVLHILAPLSSNSSHNLKQLTLLPTLAHQQHHQYYNQQTTLVNSLNKRLFDSLVTIVLGAKRGMQHLALGCLTDLNYQRVSSNRIVELIGALNKHALTLNSLHVSSVCSSPIMAFRSNKYNERKPTDFTFRLSNLLGQFVNLTQLSIDYDDLSNEFLNTVSCCLLSLQKLNLNVNTFDGVSADNTDELRVRDSAWHSIVASSSRRRSPLGVTVNFLSLQETSQKYQLVLSPFMPLETLRMYFCKSLNPSILHYLSNTYSETLTSLVVVDSIVTDDMYYYHGGGVLRYDADPEPDPLVILSWKCKHLSELIIVGYELLEINLTAIAKLRAASLRSFYVPRDCVMHLRYGHYNRHNGGFVEDDEGEDTQPDYGGTPGLLYKMRQSLIHVPDWHPLEPDELPNSVYDWRVPDEEAYLDALITDQTFNPKLLIV